MLLNIANSGLLVIDVQEKLIPAIHESSQLITNCRWLIQVAQKLAVPILVSEQYPKGLGHTVDPLRDLINEKQIIEKLHFSCSEDKNCLTTIRALKRNQLVLIGIEAHVCVSTGR